MNGNISLGRINTETNQGQSKKQGIRRLNYRCHLNEEEGRREQEAGSTWPPTHSPILHISNWERAGKYTYSIDYNKYNTSTQTFIHMHTLTTVSKWKSHGRHTKEKGHWKHWIGLHLAEKESSIELILVLICPETFVSKYTDNQNVIKWIRLTVSHSLQEVLESLC